MNTVELTIKNRDNTTETVPSIWARKHWAVYANHLDWDRASYAVTHIQTGLAFSQSYRSRRDAIRAARKLEILLPFKTESELNTRNIESHADPEFEAQIFGCYPKTRASRKNPFRD